MSYLPLAPGTLLDGRYRLRALLGEGGMGYVHEGEDIRLGRRVAIKLMREDGGDETLGERLFREAKAAARAEHPAVVTVYGFGMDAELGVSYVVMERLHGETLEARIARVGPLPIALVVRIAREAADALTAVHGAGIVHRDLKPSNLFLATRGLRVDELKLLDFGVAKQLDLHTITTTGQVYGTPAYMAPEQLRDSKHVDARCDVYALGAVLHECLTGKPPFAAPNVAALAVAVLFAEPSDPRAVRPDVPEALASAVLGCMQKQPSARYAGAAQFVAALAEL
jgi:serine/threonine protein kinase